MADPSSSSNFSEAVVTHFDWRLEVDFASHKLLCTATLHASTLAEGVAQLVGSCTRQGCGDWVSVAAVDCSMQAHVQVEVG